MDRLAWLPWLVKSWSGPVSVSVFTPGTDYAVVVHVRRYLKRCFPQIGSRVMFHFLYPADETPLVSPQTIETLQLNCSDPKAAIDYIIKELFIGRSRSRFMPQLPQNHLRNLAKRSCSTPYSLVVDIDMIPSPFMFERLHLYLRIFGPKENNALIIPVYEIKSSEKYLPANKVTLLRYIKEDRARRYHIQVSVFYSHRKNAQIVINPVYKSICSHQW